MEIRSWFSATRQGAPSGTIAINPWGGAQGWPALPGQETKAGMPRIPTNSAEPERLLSLIPANSRESDLSPAEGPEGTHSWAPQPRPSSPAIASLRFSAPSPSRCSFPLLPLRLSTPTCRRARPHRRSPPAARQPPGPYLRRRPPPPPPRRHRRAWERTLGRCDRRGGWDGCGSRGCRSRGRARRGIAGGAGPANLRGDAVEQAATNGQSPLHAVCSAESRRPWWNLHSPGVHSQPPIVPSLHALEPPWISLLPVIGACGPREWSCKETWGWA